MAQGHKLLKQAAQEDLLVRKSPCVHSGDKSYSLEQGQAQVPPFFARNSRDLEPRFCRALRWLALDRPGHQLGDPFGLPPHSFGLGEFFYHHFARDPYEIQYHNHAVGTKLHGLKFAGAPDAQTGSGQIRSDQAPSAASVEPGGRKRPAQARAKARDMDNHETTVMAKPHGHESNRESSFGTHRINPQQLNSWPQPGTSSQNPYRPSCKPWALVHHHRRRNLS